MSSYYATDTLRTREPLITNCVQPSQRQGRPCLKEVASVDCRLQCRGKTTLPSRNPPRSHFIRRPKYYMAPVLRAIVSTTSGYLHLLAVRESETAKTGPSRVASTEVVCLVDLVQVFDVLLSQVHDFRVACVQSKRLHTRKNPSYLLRIRSFVTDLGNTADCQGGSARYREEHYGKTHPCAEVCWLARKSTHWQVRYHTWWQFC